MGPGKSIPQPAAATRPPPRFARWIIAFALALLLALTWLGAAHVLRTHPHDPAVWRNMVWALAGASSALVLGLGVALWQFARQEQSYESGLAADRAALAEKTAQLEAALSGMSDGIMMMDAELRLLAWNERFPDFAGVPRNILRLGTPLADILRAQAEAGEFGPVDAATEVVRRLALIRSGESTGTMLRLRPGGRMLELRRNLLAGGGFVTLYADVTARQQSEQRLRQAEKMAAIGRLTAGVAHDFKNLLSTIIGNAELLERETAAAPSLRRRLALILQSAERGADLVHRLLAFARKQELAPVSVDLNAIVHGMEELLHATVGNGVRTRTMLCDDLWPALVDPVQMEHVILNLAINARDAMPDGGVLTIKTANLPRTSRGPSEDVPPGDYVFLAVSDTGTGMTEEVRRNAFEPFFTTKPVGEGTGLGLSQVYGVVSQSGGGVEIESVLGQGTTMRLFLPRADVDAAFAAGAGGGLPGTDRDPVPEALF
ncbi:MAG TPA: PAS-domain containing protein [Acetobacteraceae bacterium]|nr:PAS-domain containing protein [Acetobacteraceae bacterium]